MGKRNFRDLIEASASEGLFVCVGLDANTAPDPKGERAALMKLIRRGKRTPAEAQLKFCMDIVDQTHDLVAAYKLNVAFFAANKGGMKALRKLVQYIKKVAPDVVVILDAKNADIGSTNIGYVERAFERIGADAITVHPYMGVEAMRPFLEDPNKYVFVLTRTSNPGGGEFQDVLVRIPVEDRNSYALFSRETISSNTLRPLFMLVAHRVARAWNLDEDGKYIGNVGHVVGATYPEETAMVRQLVGDSPIFLIPGVGAQGGEADVAAHNGANSFDRGFLINSSRGVIFAKNPRKEVERLNRKIHAGLSLDAPQDADIQDALVDA